MRVALFVFPLQRGQGDVRMGGPMCPPTKQNGHAVKKDEHAIIKGRHAGLPLHEGAREPRRGEGMTGRLWNAMEFPPIVSS